MSAHSEIQAGLAEAFNALNVEFFPDHKEVVFLKESATTRSFETVETISSRWFLEFPTDFRETFLLQIADDSYLTEWIAQTTHVQIGDDVYSVRQADTLAPKGTSVTWKLFCDRFTERGQFRALY